MTTRTALVAGATGLVGGELIRQLAVEPSYTRVVALTRRAMDLGLERVTVLPVDYDRLDAAGDALSAEDVFCALGTTIRTAGSRDAFRHVDYDYVVALARLSRDRGARHFLLVSSLGANARSRVFYGRVKGEVEDAIRSLGYPSVTIVRPSLLLGDRSEFRLGEALAKPFGFLFPRSYRPVHARTVAAAMIAAAKEQQPGVRVVPSRDLAALAFRASRA